MKTIWKFDIQITDFFQVEMPIGSKILAAQIQKGHPVFWAEVDTKQPMMKRSFAIVGTGNPVPEGFSYVTGGTFQMGIFVWHLYVGKE